MKADKGDVVSLITRLNGINQDHEGFTEFALQMIENFIKKHSAESEVCVSCAEPKRRV